MAWRRPVDKPLFEQMLVTWLLTPTCVTQYLYNYLGESFILIVLCFYNLLAATFVKDTRKPGIIYFQNPLLLKSKPDMAEEQ